MHWNFQPDIPIYLQIEGQLEQMIASGVIAPGERLPSVREFALEAGVNPNTMQKALAELEKKGVVYSRRTSGRFVTDDPERLSALRMELAGRETERFVGAMQRLGFTAAQTVGILEKFI